jgi:CBS domain-containing protein
MFVREILAHKGREVKSVEGIDTLEVAAAVMRTDRVGALVVRDEMGRLKGLLSEQHVVWAIADTGARALSLPVAQVMETDLLTCTPDDTVARVARLMTERRARHVPVVANDKVTGIISIGDLVKARFEEFELERGTLRDLAMSRQLGS